MNLVEDRGCSLGKCYLFFLVFLFFCVECDSRVGVLFLSGFYFLKLFHLSCGTLRLIILFFVWSVFRLIILSAIWKARGQNVNIVVLPWLHSLKKAFLEAGVFIMAASIMRNAIFNMQDHVVVPALMSSVLILKMAFQGSGLMMAINSFMKNATRRKCLLKWGPNILSWHMYLVMYKETYSLYTRCSWTFSTVLVWEGF